MLLKWKKVMYWINGEVKDAIALGDRSFQYGDGGFTTMLVVGGEVQLWSYHQERLAACLTALQIMHPDWTQVYQWVKRAIDIQPTQVMCGIKIHISRGIGGRGYSVEGFGLPTVTISVFQFPTHYRTWIESGIALGICHKRLGLNPMLAGHKHNNRLEQVLLKAELEQRSLADGVVLDLNDHVIESTMANIFWFKKGVLHTPNLEQAGVAGVMRRWVIEQANLINTTVRMSCYKLDDLLSADEVFLTNSLLGVAPITAIENQVFEIGSVTHRLKKRVVSV
jgi:4-amino-4-deoxychorismate lyase